jgi:hypothetical protein
MVTAILNRKKWVPILELRNHILEFTFIKKQLIITKEYSKKEYPFFVRIKITSSNQTEKIFY